MYTEIVYEGENTFRGRINSWEIEPGAFKLLKETEVLNEVLKAKALGRLCVEQCALICVPRAENGVPWKGVTDSRGVKKINRLP